MTGRSVRERRFGPRLHFCQILSLLPEKLRPEGRKTFKAYNGVNNIFNLAYEVLSWKVHRAIVRAKLEPYLGFLHSVQESKPSLVCDLEELYRYLLDDFLICYRETLNQKDFILKPETLSKGKLSKREYLDELKTNDLLKRLDDFLSRSLRSQESELARSRALRP